MPNKYGFLRNNEIVKVGLDQRFQPEGTRKVIDQLIAHIDGLEALLDNAQEDAASERDEIYDWRKAVGI